MSDDTIGKLARLGAVSEEHLAFVEAAGRADLTLTALAVAIRALERLPFKRDGGDLKAMKLLFHEVAGDDAEVWEGRAEVLLDGADGKA